MADLTNNSKSVAQIIAERKAEAQYKKQVAEDAAQKRQSENLGFWETMKNTIGDTLSSPLKIASLMVNPIGTLLPYNPVNMLIDKICFDIPI